MSPTTKAEKTTAVFEQYVKMGYMSFGLECVIRLAFDNFSFIALRRTLNPSNYPSKWLIKKMGFRCEGISQKFICINGEWIDHERGIDAVMSGVSRSCSSDGSGTAISVVR